MALRLSFNNSETGCENTVHNQPVLYSKRRLSVSSSSSEATVSAEEEQPSEVVHEQPKQVEKKKTKSKSSKKPNPLADKELLPVYEDFMSHHQPEPQLESAVEKIIQSYFKKAAAKKPAKESAPSESEEEEEEEEIEPPKAKKSKASTSKPKANPKSKVKESPDLKLLKQLSKSIESLQQKLNKALDKPK